MTATVERLVRKSGVWLNQRPRTGGVLPPTQPPATRVVIPGVTFPTAANTGTLAGTQFKGPYGPGDTFRDDNGAAFTISTKGVLTLTGPVSLTGYDLRCAINVKTGTSKARIANSRIHPDATWTDGLTGLSQVIYAPNAQHSDFQIADTEIWAEKPSDWTDGLKGAGWNSYRLNIHDVTDTMLISGNDTYDEASWLHDNKHWDVDRTKNGGPSHDDGVQIEGGSNNELNGTRIDGAFNSGIQVTQNSARINGLRFRRIWVGGGQYTVNVAEKAQGPLQGLEFIDVLFFGTSALNVDAGVPATTRADPTFVFTAGCRNLKLGTAAILKNA